MSESNDPVIHAAAHSIKGNLESKLSAGTLLEALRKSEPIQEKEALERWNALESKRPRVSWLWKFSFIVVGVCILITTFTILDLWGYVKIYRMAFSYEDAFPSALIDHNPFNAHQKLLLTLGDGDSARTEIAKALWDSAPDNPAYFWEYGNAHFAESGKLPADFLEQARRIDPQNAFFPYWAAAAEAKDTVKKQSLSKAAKALGTKPGWDILDETRLNNALAILYNHQNLRDCRSYEIEMIRERIPLLTQKNYFEYYRSLAFLSRSSYFFPPYRDLSNALAAKAWSFGELGDTAGFLELKKTADLYLKNISSSHAGNLLTEILIEVSAKTILENLTNSATKLGLTAEAAESQLPLDRLAKLTNDRKAGVFQIGGQEAGRKVGLLDSSAMVARRALHPPTLTDNDVKPGRMVAHLFLAQICTYGVLSLLGVIAGVISLYRFRSPRVIQKLSERMVLLLRPVDWAWLFLAGFPPFIYLSLISHLTPLGGYEFGLTAMMVEVPYDGTLPLPVIQFAGMFLMILISPVLVVRWRFSKRVTFFGFGNPRLGLGMMAALSAAAFIPVLGWAATHSSLPGLVASWVLFGIPLAWILGIVIRAMTTGAGQLLQLTSCSRVLVPTYSAAVLILVVASLFFKPMRQYWFERDPMARLDVAYPSLTKFEYDVSVAARKELREALGYD